MVATSTRALFRAALLRESLLSPRPRPRDLGPYLNSPYLSQLSLPRDEAGSRGVPLRDVTHVDVGHSIHTQDQVCSGFMTKGRSRFKLSTYVPPPLSTVRLGVLETPVLSQPACF